jgi:NarL family two-component system response regulator LiaR
MSKIKIAIVDDDPVWLNAMASFINETDDMLVSVMALNKEEILYFLDDHEIDIILMDINLGNGDDGIYLTAEISEKKGAKTIMLTSLENEEFIINSFTAGAVNYVSKENYRDIPAIIRSVHHKISPFELLVKDYGRLKEAEQIKSLSAAEKELLEFIQKGYSQSEIARILYKSIGTIKSQINKILKKLEVNSSKDALKKIRWKGLFK